MKFYLTGERGFIGSNLVEALKKSGEVEVCDGNVCEKLESSSKPDIVYHLAANTDTTFPDDVEMYRNNILGALNVLDFALKNKARLIYASSGAIYGNAGKPLNSYGMSKVIIDEIMKKFFDRIPIVGLRFFNVYGKGEIRKGKMASMITQWREQITRGERPVCFDDNAKRDFVYVKDVVKSLIQAQNMKSGIYDVGTGIPVGFQRVLQLVIQNMGAKIEPRFIPNPHKGKYQMFTKADISWGFKPDYTVEKGIKDYFENY